MVKDDGTLVILGNGFDVNIGLPTKYSQFLDSDIFKNFMGLIEPGNPGEFAGHEGLKEYNLLHYIYKKHHYEKWSDLESLLYLYAKKGREEIAPSGKLINQENVSDENRNEGFNLLRQSLWSYLKNISYDGVDKSSLAAGLLMSISRRNNVVVWSFNYTGIRKLFPFLGIGDLNCIVKHVHGTLENNDIIVGVQSDAEIDDSYNYMKKLNDPRHHFSGFSQKLIAASKVIIFGHSLGDSDKDYFSEYFKYLSTEECMNKSRELVIITYNDESARSILTNINKLSGNKLGLVKSHVTMDIVKTAYGKTDIEQIWGNREL